MAKKPGFIKAFSQVASGTFLSRVLGVVREQVFAHLFGASMAADAFFAAFRIPNLLRDLFAEGALSSAFIPVFRQEMKDNGREASFELAQACFALLTMVLFVVITIGVLLAPFLVKIMAPGFDEIAGKLELTTELTIVMFPFLLLVALAALTMSILNSFDRFTVPALAPALFNVGMITAAVAICPYLERPIFGMAVGVLLGGFGQLVIQLPGLRRIGFRFSLKPNLKHPGIKKIGKLISPMIAGLAAGRVNIFINTLLASFLGVGAISYLNYSYRIMHLPLGMIAVALGTVALPRASAQAAEGDLDGIARTFYRSIQLCFFLVFPMAAFFIVCGDQIIALLFEHGKFNTLDTANTYSALIWYSVGLIGFAGVRVTAPVYYSLKDATRPMRFSIIAVATNLAAYMVFIPMLGFAGLAAATALGGLVNLFLLILYIPRLVEQIKRRPVVILLVKSILGATLMGLLVFFISGSQWLANFDTGLVARLLKISILFGIGMTGYLLISFALNNLPARQRSVRNHETPGNMGGPE